MKPFSNESAPVAPVRIVAQSGAPISIYSIPGWTSAPLAETTLMSFTLPGGSMGPNGSLRVSYLASMGATANQKTTSPKFGGNTFGYINNTNAGAKVVNEQRWIRNRNNAASQVWFSNSSLSASYNYSGSSPGTMAVNSAIDQSCSITATTTLETGFTPTGANMSGTGSVVTVNYAGHGLNSGEYIQAAGSSTAGYNADPVIVTVVNANQFTYPASGTGTPGTAPTIKRYTPIQLEAYTWEVLPSP